MSFTYRRASRLKPVLLSPWKKSKLARISQGKLSASSFDHVLPTYLLTDDLKKRGFFYQLLQEEKIAGFFVGIYWYDLIKFITSFLSFQLKIVSKCLMEASVYFQEEKSAYFECVFWAMCWTWINNFGCHCHTHVQHLRCKRTCSSILISVTSDESLSLAEISDE